MKARLLTALAIAVAMLMPQVASAQSPKREFRGAWLHTIFQGQYKKQTTEENKAYLRDQFDKLQAAGVNAILFQVRPQADALYPSELEPWSRFLTDDGKAPEPYWDPLQFVIDEAHKRGMELHAWMNPYRVTSNTKQTLPPGHIYHKHPERFVTYDGKLYFEPSLPENRQFIEDVVMDVINRYDVDGIHFDDYFYPYPAKGIEFPDAESYARTGDGLSVGDWRRRNVDLLIEGIHQRIASSDKPWVRFGISPFGIWRNSKTDPRGSRTNGLQNYDDLYADVLLWAENGWIDYLLPQLYWELEHKSASYIELVDWWNLNNGGRHMYIGQDVKRTMELPDLAPSKEASQLRHKVQLARNGQNIQGMCWWPGYAVTANVGGVADSLRTDLMRLPALVPNYPWISAEQPQAVSKLSAKGRQLSWSADQPQGKVSDQVKFVVYRVGEEIDIDSPEAIVAITPSTAYTVDAPGRYAVTALDRVNNESLPTVVIVE